MYERPNYPRDKDQLLKEMDVRMKLGDIRRLHELRERISPQWWEPALVVILFAAALGLLASLHQYTRMNRQPLTEWMFFWFGLLILMIVFYFQIILLRIYHFRRVSQVMMKGIEDLRERMDKLEERMEQESAAPEESGNAKSG